VAEERKMNWIQNGTALTVLVGAVYAGVITLATKTEVHETEDRMLVKVVENQDNIKLVQRDVRKMKVDDQILFQMKVIMMLEDKCGSGQCSADEKACLEDAKTQLKSLREEREDLLSK
jgi:hypothetical protein